MNRFNGSVSILAMALAGVAQTAHAQATAGSSGGDDIIVTGTRDVGVTARASAAPIQVVSAATLKATGANNVFDALQASVPSLSGENFKQGRGEFTRSARLRGMSPNEVLVLVNGKRRHNSANVDPQEGPDVSSNPADLDMIPISAIDHVEVLTDGAAAQYGSDAVAGVINIILKHNSSGTSIYAGGGLTAKGDGAQGEGGVNTGLKLGSDGFVSLSLDYHFHGYENRNDINVTTIGTKTGPSKNKIDGSPLSNLVVGGFNLEKPLSPDVTFYAFGTAGYKYLSAYQNSRPDTKVPSVYPQGFTPIQINREVDGSLTAGLKGHKLAGFDWDVSGTYARDTLDLSIVDTINTGLLKAGLYSATFGKTGSERNDQTTINADLRRGFDVGLADPVNVAFGGEFRHEFYTLGAGDPVTYLLGGTQAAAGFPPQTVSPQSRNVEAAYIDVGVKPVHNWSVDVAGRFEHYGQAGVGSTVNGKLTTRYDFSPQFAVRGTIGTGFHAPTLAQSFYAITGVNPTSATLVAPPTSAGGVLIGAEPLKPEKSLNLSAGFVAELVHGLHLTVDAYQIKLKHRIITSQTYTGAPALAAAAANGIALDPTSTAFFSFFTNGVDTRTRGVDATLDYTSNFGDWGTVNWSLAANYNAVDITKAYAPSARLLANYPGTTNNLNPQVIEDIERSSPDYKVTAAAHWHIKKIDFTVRETRYGSTYQNTGNTSAITNFASIHIKPAFITDLDLVYHVNDDVSVDIGGNNVFDHLPPVLPMELRQGRGSDLYPAFTPWGISGGYYYAKLRLNF